MPSSEHPRSVRSYVTRSGRITDAQQRALETLWPKYGLAFGPRMLELEVVFGRRAHCSIEIGFGHGDHLAALAAAHPERDYLGIEVHRPGVGRLLRMLEAQQLRNVRVVCHDAVEVLEKQLPARAVREIWILFPDPWPKKRHHKRRRLQPAFIELVADRLCQDGVLHIATDWRPYAEEMLAALNAAASLKNLSAERAYSQRPAERAPTRFEARGQRLGHGVWDLAFSRR